MKLSSEAVAKRICEMTPSVAGVILPPHVRKRVIAFSAERLHALHPPALTPTNFKGKVVSGDSSINNDEREETPYHLVLTAEERELCGIF